MATCLPGAASRRMPACALQSRIATETPRLASQALHRIARGAIACVAASLLLAACGGGSDGEGGSPGGTPGSTPAAANYFPLAQGDRWLYHESWDGGDAHFQVDVGGDATIDGHAATSLVFTAIDGTLLENRNYGVDASGVSFYPDASDNDPMSKVGPQLTVPARVDAGTSMVVANRTGLKVIDFDGDGRQDTVDMRLELEVVGVESITTPAGTFANALHEHVIETATARGTAGTIEPFVVTTHVHEWFVPGVGRVLTQSTTTSTHDFRVDTDTVELVAFRTTGLHGGAQPEVNRVEPNGYGDKTLGRSFAEVAAFFSMPMDVASLDAGGFIVSDANGHAVAGHAVVSSDGAKATFVPDAGWRDGRYTASITSSALNRYGSAALLPATWSFAFDVTSPTIVGTTPADLAAVDGSTPIVVQFSEALQPDSVAVAGGGVTLVDDATGLVSFPDFPFDGVSTFAIRPSMTPWEHGHSYTITFDPRMFDFAGNTLGDGVVVHFRVG